MGTKMGGKKRYGPYTPITSQVSLYDERKEITSATYEDRFEQMATEKLSRVQPNRAELRDINNFGDEVQNAIRQKLSIKERHMFGSSVKNTMVYSSHKKDADILIVLDLERHGKWLNQDVGSSNAQKALKESLTSNPKYAGANIYIDGSAVVVEQGGKSVDLVLSFRNPNGRGFLIPEGRNGATWIRTDPRTSKRILDIVDKKHYGQVRPLIQLAKDWNERHGRKLKSYHVEAMVVQHFMNNEPNKRSSLHSNVDKFFHNFPEYISSSQIKDPATDENLGSYLSRQTKDEVIKESLKTRKYVDQARSANEEFDAEKSLYYYRRVLYDNLGETNDKFER